MSERTFFNWRTTLPGFTFLLLVLAINYAPLIKILSDLGMDSVFGALLGFITLISGSAIGFLLSQVWWRWYCYQGAHYFYPKGPRKEITTLIDKYGLKSAKNKKDREIIQNVVTVYSYIIFKQKKKKGGNAELVDYIVRRGDSFHTFSATRIILILGIVFGIIIRFFSQFFVFHWNLNVFRDSISGIPQKLGEVFNLDNFLTSIPDSATGEIFVLIGLIFLAIILYFIFGKAREWVLEQYSRMAIAMINQSKVTIEKLRGVFPKDYFDKQD